MKINTNSWHYQLLLAVHGSGYIRYQLEDSCAYIRDVIKTTFIFCLLCVTVVLAFFLIGASFITFWLHILGLMVGDEVAVVGGAIITLGILATALSVLITNIYERRFHLRYGQSKPKTPGFFAQAKDRIKNKFCSRLEIVE